jgi:hypothetical protein
LVSLKIRAKIKLDNLKKYKPIFSKRRVQLKPPLKKGVAERSEVGLSAMACLAGGFEAAPGGGELLINPSVPFQGMSPSTSFGMTPHVQSMSSL